jgi:hypothetical protein
MANISQIEQEVEKVFSSIVEGLGDWSYVVLLGRHTSCWGYMVLNRFVKAITINRKRDEWEGGTLPGGDVDAVVKLSTHLHPLTS